jgi:RTX toxin acyltransferase family
MAVPPLQGSANVQNVAQLQLAIKKGSRIVPLLLLLLATFFFIRQLLDAALAVIDALLARAPGYKDMKLADLEWLVMPALAAGQYRIAETKLSETVRGGVAAALLYARVSAEVAARLDATKTHPVRLSAEEWTSGAIVRPILALGRKAALDAMMADFRKEMGLAAAPTQGGGNGRGH